MRLALGILWTLLSATHVMAATITVAPQRPDRLISVVVEGDLVASDADEFLARTASLSGAIIAFSSDGGSLVAGIRIGEFIRQKGFATLVPKMSRCVSACALAWLGGSERFIGAGAQIGFHAAYDPTTARETGVGTALVGAYLTRIGLPYEAVIYITRAGPTEMTWLNVSEAAQRGIRVTPNSFRGCRSPQIYD
jgi:hypothetical protein